MEKAIEIVDAQLPPIILYIHIFILFIADINLKKFKEISVIVAVMDAYPENTNLLQNALLLLKVMTALGKPNSATSSITLVGGNSRIFVEEGGVPIVTEILRQYFENAEFTILACDILYKGKQTLFFRTCDTFHVVLG